MSACTCTQAGKTKRRFPTLRSLRLGPCRVTHGRKPGHEQRASATSESEGSCWRCRRTLSGRRPSATRTKPLDQARHLRTRLLPPLAVKLPLSGGAFARLNRRGGLGAGGRGNGRTPAAEPSRAGLVRGSPGAAGFSGAAERRQPPGRSESPHAAPRISPRRAHRAALAHWCPCCLSWPSAQWPDAPGSSFNPPKDGMHAQACAVVPAQPFTDALCD